MVTFRPRNLLFSLIALGLIGQLEGSLKAASIDSFHTTDGSFTTANEWFGRSTIASTNFLPVNNSGGAVLSVEGSPTTLYLMYDYYNSPNVGPLDHVTIAFNSKELGGSVTTYAIDIKTGQDTFQAFEKPANVSAPEVNGAFDLTAAPWTQLSSTDLLQAHFHTALGFGSSPTSSIPHFIAEFDLSSRTDSNPDGLYSPDPQFWSGSGTSPFSSEIFLLNKSDGSVHSTAPVLDQIGAPVLQQTVPEPGSLTLLSVGAVGLLIETYRRRRPAKPIA